MSEKIPPLTDLLSFYFYIIYEYVKKRYEKYEKFVKKSEES